MSNIAYFPTADLEKEIARRRGTKPRRPEIVSGEISLNMLRGYCECYLDDVESGEGDLGDAKQYIFEAAMTAFYGEGVWKFINSHS